ncbi:hypothetical protein GGH12_003344 [Coemansia sp. RSA 1822]|nr:hypothetical protein GGF49_000509 [Coemansia sp. RSA 1853]KAJ2562290.1 hypothetical protein GGH12_003344 [Coemansia sp. RSA 1822]
MYSTSIVFDAVGQVLHSPLTLPIVVVCTIAIILHRVFCVYTSLLRDIPGPFIARLTPLHLEASTVRGRMAAYGLSHMHTHGDIFVCQPRSVCISDPSDIRRILSSSSFHKSPYYRVLQFTGIDSIISTSEPHAVSMKRRMLGPFFKQSQDQRIQINYEATFSMCTFNVISRLVFGQDIAALDPRAPEESLKWMTDATTYMSIRALLRLLPSFVFRAVTWPWEHLYDKFTDHVRTSIDTRAQLLREKCEERPVDLLQALMDCTDPESKVTLQEEEIHAESLLLLIGGIDPTAYTLTWTLHMLMLYPQCYEQLKHEIRSHFPSQEISYAMAKDKLPYLEACIYESMRLVPVPHVMIPRIVPNAGTTIKGHYLPPGTTVFANIVGSHLNPTHWPDPHRFDPTRFLDPHTRRTAIHSVFTFGYGNRICMGKHLAWLNMTTILANLLQKFDFSLPDGYTRTGPNVIDPATGHPKLMDRTEFITAKPANHHLDCMLVVTSVK